jgi:hypothetical protein
MTTKNKHLSVYVDADEEKTIRKNAAFFGLSVSKFLLTAGLNELPQPEELKQLWFDFVIEVSRLNKSQMRNALNLELLKKGNPEITELKSAILEAKETAKETAALVKKLAEKF